MYGIVTIMYLHLVEFCCTCSAIIHCIPYTHQTSSNTNANIPQVRVWKMCRLFCSVDIMRPPKWSKFQRQIIATKLSLGREYCISSSQAWIMLWISGRGSPQIRMLTCYCPKPSLPHTLWGSVFRLTFTPPVPSPSLRAIFPLKSDKKKKTIIRAGSWPSSPSIFWSGELRAVKLPGCKGIPHLGRTTGRQPVFPQLFWHRRRRVVGPSCESLLKKNWLCVHSGRL